MNINRMNINRIICFISSLPLLWVASYSCSGTGVSSPTTPAQIPNSIEYASLEYAGGDVDGAISVQMGKTLSFVVKDAEGNVITDPDVTIELLDTSASSDISSPAKSAGPSADTVVTDDSCGTAVVSGSEIISTAPNNWKGVASVCKIQAIYDGDALSGQFDMKISLSSTVAASNNFSFEKNQIASNGYTPDMTTDDNGVIFLCYRDVNTLNTNLIKSSDAGTTWSAPLTVPFSSTTFSFCSVAASRDGTKVAVAGKYLKAEGSGVTIAEELAYSSDGGASFASVTEVYKFSNANSALIANKPVMAMDSNGIVHIVVHKPWSAVSSDLNITACTSTTCGDFSGTEISGTPETAMTDPQIAIARDDTIYAIWIDGSTTGDGNITSMTYDGNSYSLGTPVQFTDGTAARRPRITMDRLGIPVLVWEYMTTSPYSELYIGSWDVSRSEVTEVTLLSDDDDPSLLKLDAKPFVAYDNHRHVLFKLYNATVDSANVFYRMENDEGGFISPRSIAMIGFDSLRTKWSVITDPVGRPYFTWMGSPQQGVYNIYFGRGVIGQDGSVTYTIGGTVSGLTGNGFVLQNNGGDDLAVSTIGSFTFATAQANSSAYAVTIKTHPSGQTCTIVNGSGTINGYNIHNVTVTCSAKTYTVGGSVSGLTGSGLVLAGAGRDPLSISANGAFTFSNALADSTAYEVTVSTQPTGQTCTVTNGSGTISGANVTNVAVACAANTYSIGGTLDDLGEGKTITLQNNGGDDLTLNADGEFAFDTEVADGGEYDVTVLTQPTGQACTVTSGSGTVSGADVTDVAVTCVNSYLTFVTAGTHDANFNSGEGGIAGADAFCMADANYPGTGTYKALITDGTNRIACTTENCGGGAGEHADWILQASSVYYRADASTVIGTTNSVGIFDFPLDNTFAGGDAVTFWSGLFTDWTTHWDICTGWSSSDDWGWIGSTGFTDSQSIIWTSTLCANEGQLLCVEQ